MLPELNPLTKTQLNQMDKNIANEVDRCVERWMDYADFINTLTDPDLQNLPSGNTDPDGYSAGSIANIRAFRIALLNMYEAYKNQAKTGSGDPSYTVGLLKDAVVF